MVIRITIPFVFFVLTSPLNSFISGVELDVGKQRDQWIHWLTCKFIVLHRCCTVAHLILGLKQCPHICRSEHLQDILGLLTYSKSLPLVPVLIGP